MAQRQWTDEQLSAINTRDKTLLVSAAAGSGKTATLTERIIRQLTSSTPVSIDRMLIVTFTKAATAELKDKISKALSDAVKANPEDKRLEEQLFMLPSAKIRTIDSFCGEILRANCDRVGLSPNYRIADTAECELLALSILENLIEAVYNGEEPDIASPEQFEELCDCLTDSKKTEELSEVFRVIHSKFDNDEGGIDSLEKLIELYDETLPVEENAYGKYLMERFSEMIGHYFLALGKCKNNLESGKTDEKFRTIAELDLALLEELLSCKTYEKAKEKMSVLTLKTSPQLKDDASDYAEIYHAKRKMLREDLRSFANYFTYSPEDWKSFFISIKRLLKVLFAFEKKFDLTFTEEKRRLGALSYGDVERYAYACLLKNGEPTDVAMSIREQFDAIYIDEYQDVNNLQNRIFEAIAKPNNRFMVGDIKQSIYGFRSSNPEIFAKMKSDFPALSEASPSPNASVYMSKNFRCDKAIVDFVNGIFDKVFGILSETIGYKEGDRLGYGKIQESGEPEYKKPEIYTFEKIPTDNYFNEEENSETENPLYEASFVAKKIDRLLREGRLNNGEKIKPSDIAIIMRNAKGVSNLYAEALEKEGIPSCIVGNKSFFLSAEILLTLCFLNSIDNPRRDIYLGGLMCSPLFGFTPDEILLMRREGGDTLYESLCAYVKNNRGYKKGESFLKTLNYYRTLSEGVAVDRLICKLYHETGLLALATKSGGKDNLTVLYDYARNFEGGAFKGLYNFISLINNLIDRKSSFDETRDGSEINAVKIVTSHASKGLEYPVVFFVNTGRKFENKDSRNRVVFSEGFGISFRIRTPSGLALVNNPVYSLINHKNYRKLFEEEMRVLYVTLTRAREKLYVVGTSPIKELENYYKKVEAGLNHIDEYSLRKLTSFLDIVQVLSNETSVDRKKYELDIDSENPSEEEELSLPLPEDAPFDEEKKEMFVQRFSYKYPMEHLTHLPEKMSVSNMSPTVLDGTDSEIYKLDFTLPEIQGENSETPANAGRKTHLPDFKKASATEESAKRGIATHLFMQFFSLGGLDANGAEGELDRLYKNGFISAEDKGRVRISEIEAFRKSELFKRMKDAEKLYRELRFNIRLPAKDFTSDSEKKRAYGDREIQVQGVIDCIIVGKDGEILLCDYKTDRLTEEQLTNRALAEDSLKQKHSTQLLIYSKAVEKIFGKAPSEIALYSLHLGDTVSII